jgi:hypothetical protein
MSTISHLLTTFLVNSLWQIPLIAAVTALCATLIRPVPSAYRHVVWVVALGLCLGLPLTSHFQSSLVSSVRCRTVSLAHALIFENAKTGQGVINSSPFCTVPGSVA